LGLLNYLSAFQDPIFLTALRNTLVFVFFSITLQNAIALFAAIFMYMGSFRGSTILRAVIFFPGVLSAVVVSLVWRNVVLLRGGLIPQLAQLLGIPNFFPLSNPDLAFYVIVLISIWQWTGFNFVIFYAGLQTLEEDLRDAAQVDGASFWQLVFKIIIPQQWQVVLTNVILNLIGGFQVFDIVYVMTNGGPAHTTEALATYMVQKAFVQGQSRMSYAAAIASMIMIMSIAFAAFRNRISRALD
jgi:raffinose/stachyose/melibiose transport system permease protein